MNNIVLHNSPDITYTYINNLFIDEYMPYANGSYVKVYLLIMRRLSENCTGISISSMADILELTEKDILRALKYWGKCNLLEIKTDSNGDICDITVNKPVAAKKADNIVVLDPSAKTSGKAAAKDMYRRTYTMPEIEAVAAEPDFAWTLNIIEKYMEQPLSATDVELVVYLYDNLKFSPELILHLYEHCISRGKKSSKYIQTVAINWAKEGIDTVEKATQYSLQYDADYMSVMKALGLSQAPAPAQKKYIDSWIAMGFTNDMILEACNRTILAINKPNFKYINTILEKWNKAGIHTVNDIKKDDMMHADDQKKTAKQSGGRRNSFNSFEQRKYSGSDYSALEKLLSK